MRRFSHAGRNRKKPARVLLVEGNNMSKWVGTTMPYEVHIPPLGLMYLASYARTALPGIEFRIVESSLSSAQTMNASSAS